MCHWIYSITVAQSGTLLQSNLCANDLLLQRSFLFVFLCFRYLKNFFFPSYYDIHARNTWNRSLDPNADGRWFSLVIYCINANTHSRKLETGDDATQTKKRQQGYLKRFKAKINETYLQMKLTTSDTLELRVIFERLSGAPWHHIAYLCCFCYLDVSTSMGTPVVGTDFLIGHCIDVLSI